MKLSAVASYPRLAKADGKSVRRPTPPIRTHSLISSEYTDVINWFVYRKLALNTSGQCDFLSCASQISVPASRVKNEGPAVWMETPSPASVHLHSREASVNLMVNENLIGFSLNHG